MNDVMAQMKTGTVNGIDVDALKQVVSDVSQDPAKGVVRFKSNRPGRGRRGAARPSNRSISAARR